MSKRVLILRGAKVHVLNLDYLFLIKKYFVYF